jgi:hypothetical protein
MRDRSPSKETHEAVALLDGDANQIEPPFSLYTEDISPQTIFLRRKRASFKKRLLYIFIFWFFGIGGLVHFFILPSQAALAPLFEPRSNVDCSASIYNCLQTPDNVNYGYKKP